MADAVRSKGTFDAFILRWRTTSRSWNCACNSGKLQLFPIASRNVLNFNWIWLQQELDSQPKNDPTVVQDQEQRQLINLLPTAVTNFKPFTTTTVRYGWIDLKLHSFHRILLLADHPVDIYLDSFNANNRQVYRFCRVFRQFNLGLCPSPSWNWRTTGSLAQNSHRSSTTFVCWY